MARRNGLAAIAVFLILNCQIASAQSTVGMDDVVRLETIDLALEGASLSPDGRVVVAHGGDPSIFLIDPIEPRNHVKLDSLGFSGLHDSSFHPSSESALIVGEGGVVLRLVMENNSLEKVGGEVDFGTTDLYSVSWNSDGSWAYIGGEEGWIWRVRSLEGAGLEAIPLDGRGQSDVNGISCISGQRFCVISSSVDGIGVIDENHEVKWIGGVGYPWVGVVCPSSSELSCVCVSTELTIAVVTINSQDASKSVIFDNDIVRLQGIDGMIRGIDFQHDGRSLISIAPFGLIEHDIYERTSYKWIENSDAVNFSVEVSDEMIVSSWGAGPFEGWLITSEGTMVSYSLNEGNSGSGLLGIWIGVVIIGGTSLLFLSLLTSSSPRLSRLVAKWIGSEEERKRAIREERVSSRKRKRA